MTDREKLLDLYNKIKSIEIPVFENSEVQVIANTIKAGLDLMIKWVVDVAKKHFTTNR